MRREPAPFAVDPEKSRGRLHPEPESRHRSPYQRDRDRIIHSTAFRRLKHKTQVFVEHEGDHYRTRLTHSIEVGQITRTIARSLGLDEDLSEALALAHDLGHTPFGHAGETVLNRLTAECGGFDHNAQALRVVTELERRYAQFDGLNLTWETLEGLAKHNGPLTPPYAFGIGEYDARHPLELDTHASAEAQVAALSDDIAYNNHDLDDGLRAGLFTLEEARTLSLVGPHVDAVERAYPGLERGRLRNEALRRVFGAMVDDVLAESRRRIDALAPRSADDVRAASGPVVAFSPAFAEELGALRRFLFQRMYRHTRVNRMMSKAKRMLADMFELLMAEPMLMPPQRRAFCEAASPPERARMVADYIAGMTDRYALDEHRRLFNPGAGA